MKKSMVKQHNNKTTLPIKIINFTIIQKNNIHQTLKTLFWTILKTLSKTFLILGP